MHSKDVFIMYWNMSVVNQYVHGLERTIFLDLIEKIVELFYLPLKTLQMVTG